MSFRIEKDLADALETEATIKNITPSTLLNQILQHHIGYEGNKGKAGLVSFSKHLIARLMEGYPEKKIIAMAEYISKDPMTDTMAVLKLDYSLEIFLSMIEDYAKDNNFAFRHIIKGNMNTCILQHDMGRNVSVYLAHLYKYVIEELAQKRVAIDITNNTVGFRF
jgi:hypothetical protein